MLEFTRAYEMNFSLVEFASEKDVEEAIKTLHETTYEGAKIEVKRVSSRRGFVAGALVVIVDLSTMTYLMSNA